MSKLLETRCCCDAKLRGYLPKDSDSLPLRETVDEETGKVDVAFSSEGMTDTELMDINGFIPTHAEGVDKKTWRKDTKTWRKK